MRFAAPGSVSHENQYIPTRVTCKTVLTSRGLTPTIPYVMFRPRLSFTLAFIAAVSLFSRAADAQSTGSDGSVAGYHQAIVSRPRGDLEPLARAIAANDATGSVRRIELAGASDIVAGYAIGTSAPYTAIIASIAAAGESRWSEAAWLSILHGFAADPSAAVSGTSSGTVYLLLLDDEAPVAVPSPGDPLFRNLRARDALVDLGVEAVLILDFEEHPEELAMHAASWKMVTPRRVVEAARSASRFAGTPVDEVPVLDFYAASGLSSGSAGLAGWLQAGAPALLVESKATTAGAARRGPIDIASLAVQFARMTLGSYSRSRQGILVPDDDVDYLRYPTPFGIFTLPDALIVAATLIVLTALAYALALGWLKGKRRTASFKAVASEVIANFAFSLVALLGSRGLSFLAFSVAASMLGPDAISSRDSDSFSVALALGIRVLGTLSVYYTISGIASRTGLLVDHRRIDAARGALVLFFVDAVVALVLFPPVVPFLLVAMALVLFSSVTAATAGLGLIAAGIVALPFFDPRVVAAIGTAAGGPGSVASAMLDAGLRGLVAAAAFAAPFGLWINIATSPASRIRRGHRAFVFWILGSLLCAAAEVVVRIAPGSS